MYAQNRSRYNHILNEVFKRNFDGCLDIGCGTGALLSLIQQKGESVNLFGIDISSEMLEVAGEKLGPKATLVLSDSENIPFADEKMDLILCTFSFHHYPNEMQRVLKSKGRLIIADPWAPAPLRQVVNLLFHFSNCGDIKIYSKCEMRAFMEKAGLRDIVWAKVGIRGFVLTAEKH